MDAHQIENTLKKMGLVLEKLVQKVDEIDKRVAKIEEKVGDGEKKFSSQDLQAQPQTQMNQSSKNSLGGFGGSFLSSMAGVMAGMGLYNLLFNHSVSPSEFGRDLGMDDSEIEALDAQLDELDTKLEEIDSKLDELDDKISSLENEEDVMNTDYFENYEEDVSDNDFDSGFDDFGGFDEV